MIERFQGLHKLATLPLERVEVLTPLLSSSVLCPNFSTVGDYLPQYHKISGTKIRESKADVNKS